MLLIGFFTLRLGWLPPSGYVSPTSAPIQKKDIATPPMLGKLTTRSIQRRPLLRPGLLAGPCEGWITWQKLHHGCI
ncbi:hypothetical protein CHELA1G11_21248 [Hyphomicrobiales bacterium]|nr:hypothetical protein CHELA1G11_21248 [Hyphomicrobiales bacterium]CAH1693914.1 hypothetical protein CHELA1G2_21554 [Hyphomicrobiales bacterium]